MAGLGGRAQECLCSPVPKPPSIPGVHEPRDLLPERVGIRGTLCSGDGKVLVRCFKFNLINVRSVKALWWSIMRLLERKSFVQVLRRWERGARIFSLINVRNVEAAWTLVIC